MTIKPAFSHSEIWMRPTDFFKYPNEHTPISKQPSLSNPAHDTDCMNAVDHKPDINQLSGEKKSPSFI